MNSTVLPCHCAESSLPAAADWSVRPDGHLAVVPASGRLGTCSSTHSANRLAGLTDSSLDPRPVSAVQEAGKRLTIAFTRAVSSQRF